MREIVTMWNNTRMVVLTALTAALYAALLIPFKPIPIIPGFTELRPAVAVPLVFGYLFGPAGAWGSGLGNVIGDFFGGTLSLGTFFGFFGNFFLALTPYKLLAPVDAELIRVEQDKFKTIGKDLRLLLLGIAILIVFLAFLLTSQLSQSEKGKWSIVAMSGIALLSLNAITSRFALATVLASSICAAIIGWGVDLVRLVPFSVLGSMILLNNGLLGLLLGPVLLRLVLPRVAAWHLLWTDILDVPVSPSVRRRAGLICMWVGGLGAFIIGMVLSTGLYGGQIPIFHQDLGGLPGLGVAVGVPPFLVLFLIGCLLA